MITNNQLCAYVTAMIGHPYWYGCFGQISSKKLYNAKKKQYPKYYEWECPQSQLGTRVFDCVGLIKGALWSKGVPSSSPHYVKSQDVSANGMYAKCIKKGPIKTIPEVKGVLVFQEGHVGVYVGNGKVIEARGHAWGVVKTELKNRGWKNWGYCPWVYYVDSGKEEKPVEKPKEDAKYYKQYKGDSAMIDTVFRVIGVPDKYIGNWKKRKPVAKANGIKAYIGTFNQNVKLINLARQGALRKP